MTRKRPVWIDTDPGVDDALALLLALRSPELRVVGISTTHGNVGLPRATENACRVVELANVAAPPPIYRGASRPLAGRFTRDSRIHGADGLGDVTLLRTRTGVWRYPKPRLRPSREPAVEALIAAAHTTRPKLTVITLGPLTNLALALRAEPALARRLARVVTMGGAVAAPGNETPAAEFNIYCDPEAAREVLRAGVPLTLVGLDVTRRAQVTRAELLAATKRRTPVNRFLRDCTVRIMRYYRKYEGFHGCCFHDPLTVAGVIQPSLLATERLHVDVETAGHATRGMTIADRRPIPRGHVGAPNVDVALGVQPGRFRRLLLGRVCDA